MNKPSSYLNTLIKRLSQLPGVGPKSASRLAFHILNMKYEEVEALSQAMLNLKINIQYCSNCGGISDSELCSVCTDGARDKEVVCVVEEPKDLLTIENTGGYNGTFHVLGGLISPLDGIGPDELAIGKLLHRCNEESIKEVILALNPTIEGDATAMYIAKILQPLDVKVSRIAHGLPVGADLEFTDNATIVKSIEGRVEM